MRAKPFILTVFLLAVFALTAIGVFAGPPASVVAQQATPRLIATVPPPTRVPVLQVAARQSPDIVGATLLARRPCVVSAQNAWPGRWAVRG